MSEIQNPLVSEDLSFQDRVSLQEETNPQNSETKTKVWINEEQRRLVVEDLSGGQSQQHEYPWMWLRDNCQCSECYEPISHCRIINLTEWELNIRPKEVSVSGNKNLIIKLNPCTVGRKKTEFFGSLRSKMGIL